MKISGFDFKKNSSTFIVAELSANHNQDFELAVKTILAAKKAGADAIKIQTYTAETITLNCNNEYFQIEGGTLWDGLTLYELYKKAYTPWDWQPKLKKIADEEGLIFFSSPFDKTAVDFLEELHVPAYKIASFEITDIPLIKYVASKGKPVIISTGIAALEDIELAIQTCKLCGNDQIILLKCTSEYPAPIEGMNLLTIPEMIKRFNCIAGLSDHSMGHLLPSIAVALGGRVIEKHLILDRKMGGPDSGFSMEPAEFSQMVKLIRETELALGIASYDLTAKVLKSRKFSRSLFVVEDIKCGDLFTEKNIRSIRPGDGLHTKYYDEIIGKKAKSDINRGTPLSWDFIE